MKIMNAFNTLQHLHQFIKKFEKIQKESQKLNLLQINIIRKGINYSSGMDDQIKFEKIIQQLLLMFYVILPMFQNTTQSVNNKLFF